MNNSLVLFRSWCRTSGGQSSLWSSEQLHLPRVYPQISTGTDSVVHTKTWNWTQGGGQNNSCRHMYTHTIETLEYESVGFFQSLNSLPSPWCLKVHILFAFLLMHLRVFFLFFFFKWKVRKQGCYSAKDHYLLHKNFSFQKQHTWLQLYRHRSLRLKPSATNHIVACPADVYECPWLSKNVCSLPDFEGDEELLAESPDLW